jgi:hypothetical protein
MPTFYEYEIEEGVTILVQGKSEEGGMVKASRGGAEESVVVKAEKKFAEALDGVKAAARAMVNKLEDLRADEVEVTFGLKTTGKLGNFAVGEVGAEANYTVKLKWVNKRPDRKSI